MHRIQADFETLVNQASWTAHRFLHEAKKNIDTEFEEEGYSDKHPELVIALLDAATQDFRSTMILLAAQTLADAIPSFPDPE